jgi:Flp pilus assembly protein TadD
MSVINRMLSDLHQRGESVGARSAQAASAAIVNPTMSYASSRLSAPHPRVARGWVMLGTAAAVAASLPLVWAATRPVKAEPVVVAAVATVTAESAAVSDSVWAAPPNPLSSVVAMNLMAAPALKPQPALNRGVTKAALAPPMAVMAAPAVTPAVAPAVAPATASAVAMTTPKAEVQIERRPSAARDDLARAGDAMAVGRTSEAVALLRKVIQAEPSNERAHWALLSVLAERGRDDTWRAALLDSATALPQRFGLAAAQGLNEAGRLEESLGVLNKLPEAARDLRFFSAKGATLQQLNQHAAAVSAFDTALQLAPGNSTQMPSLLVAQAVSMQALGQRTEAKQNFERVQQMPDVAGDVREFAVRELNSSRR